MTTQEEPHWKKTTTFECEECAYVLPQGTPIEHSYSEEIETFMDFATCPNCGRRAIVLR